MLIPSNIKCKVCPKIFCCSKCRQKHEIQMHMDELRLESKCFLCRGDKSFPFDKNEISINLMNHIIKVHLPLHCSKCDKIFTNKSDLIDITKCSTDSNKKKDNLCILQEEHENKENSDSRKISKELKAITDPISEIGEISEELLTPLSKWNLRWRRKSKSVDGSLTDSASSLPNLSTIHNSNSIITVNKTANSKSKKIVRSTSTPMQSEQNELPTKPTIFDSSCNSCSQMSSINVNASNESDGSPSISSHKPTFTKPRPRASKMPPSATPLRQLMSKSIQKAIAQHGHIHKKYPDAQRKMSFNSTASSNSTTIGSPLDLRTTPVIRRTQSTPDPQIHDTEIVVLNNDVTDNSILTEKNVNPASINNSDEGVDVYETCCTKLEMTGFNENNNISTTPKLTGALLKKSISFVTPIEDIKNKLNLKDDDSEDVWYTPSAKPQRSYSCSALKSSYTILQIHDDSQTHSEREDDDDDEVFYPVENETKFKKTNSGGRIWEMVTSVIRIASRNSDEPANTVAKVPTFVKRAASFAGYIRQYISDQSVSINSLEQPYKRRRTSSDNNNPIKSYNLIRSPIAKRRKRIEGRQPISRMKP